MKKMNVKQLMGASAEWLIIIVVAAYLAMQSLDFWYFVTPAEKSYLAPLGFGLSWQIGKDDFGVFTKPPGNNIASVLRKSV